ncbi:TPA: hypothetical protein ACM2MD_002098 [Raoultella planticola]
MSFTLKHTATPLKKYEEFSGAAVSCAPETVEVKYTIIGLFSMSNGVATVDFEMSLPGGVTAGYRQFSFDYAGSENPLVIAETELQKHLTS